MPSTKKKRGEKVVPVSRQEKAKRKRARREQWVSQWPEGFLIADERYNRAIRTLQRYLPLMPENTILDILAEAGLWECWLGYNTEDIDDPNRRLRFDMTRLQTCCFATAIACVGTNMVKGGEE